jgi:hypothetical protein
VIDDRGVGTTAVDVEAVVDATAGTGEPIGMEKVEELLAASLLIHEVNDREVHKGDSKEMKINKPESQETKSSDG